MDELGVVLLVAIEYEREIFGEGGSDEACGTCARSGFSGAAGEVCHLTLTALLVADGDAASAAPGWGGNLWVFVRMFVQFVIGDCGGHGEWWCR